MPFDVVSLGETMLRFSPPHGGRLEEAKTLSVYVAGAEHDLDSTPAGSPLCPLIR